MLKFHAIKSLMQNSNSPSPQKVSWILALQLSALGFMLGVITSRLIHLIFDYRPGLASLELIQNISEGRGCHVNILTKKYRNIF